MNKVKPTILAYKLYLLTRLSIRFGNILNSLKSTSKPMTMIIALVTLPIKYSYTIHSNVFTRKLCENTNYL